MKKSISITLAIGMAATGTQAVASKPVVGDYQGTVVSVGQCAFAPNPATPVGQNKVLEAIAAAAISQGINLIGKAITSAGAAKTWSVTARRNFQASTASFPHCIQVVRGSFFINKQVAATQLGHGLDKALPSLNSNGSFPAATPEFFFEGEIIEATSKAALTVRPTASYFGSPIGTRMLRPGKERSIAVFLSITGPGEKATLDTAPAATLTLGKHVPGQLRLYGDRQDDYSSPWESPWFSLTQADAVKPLTVNALETETQDASGFLTFIGSVLTNDKTQPQIVTAVQNAVLPGAAATAQLTAETSLANQHSAVETALATAITKVTACSTATSDFVTVGAAAKSALRTYVLADLALPSGDSERSGALTLAMIDPPNGINLTKPATIATSCKSILDNDLARP